MNIPPPDNHIVADLKALGFERIGEVAVNTLTHNNEINWVFRNSDHTVMAGTMSIGDKKRLEAVDFFPISGKKRYYSFPK